jgi:hypothetical protein
MVNNDSGSGSSGSGGSVGGWEGLPKTTKRIVIGVVVFAVFVLGAFVASR